MNKVGTPLLLVYELEQVPFVLPRPDETVVALDYEVELDLKKRGIPFVSLMDLARSPDGDRAILEQTRHLARFWYSAPSMEFYEHDGIRLGEQHEVAVLYYIQTVVYWVAMLGQVFAHFGDLTGVRVFESHHYVPPTADPTGAFKERAAFDVAHLLCKQKGVACETILAPLSHRAQGRLSVLRRSVLELLVRAAVAALNAVVNLFVARRPLVVFASDPWSRLEPFVSHMPDVELIMTRRKELRAMGLRAILGARARFHHRLDFVDRSVRELAREKAQSCAQTWKVAQAGVSEGFRYEGVSYWPVVGPMFDSIVNDHTEDAVATIENTKRIFRHYGVNRVLLFASTKGYNNVVAHVAQLAGIPSAELQHALVNNEKTLVHCRLNSRYLASYGPLINRIYESWGVAPWRLVSCGSPRFDRYSRSIASDILDKLRNKRSLSPGKLNVLWGMPSIYASLEYGNYTSYEVRRVMEDVAAAQRRHPQLCLLLRPRPDPNSRSFYEREENYGLFADKRMVQFDDLGALLGLCDVVLTGTSTVVVEAMLMHKPVVLYIPKLLDRDLEPFWQSGAILMARNKEELSRCMEQMVDETRRAALVARADEFLEKNFLLDGKSAQRVAALLRTPPNPPQS